MTEIFNSAQMRAIEAAAMASGDVTGLELMERAGQGVVDAIFDAFPNIRRATGHALILCGPGNNGGDGFVIARLLKTLGWQVEVFLYGDPAKLPPDAGVNYTRWCDLGEVQALNDASAAFFDETLDLIVDALFGIGLSSPLPSEVEHVLSEIQETKHRRRLAPATVAVDVPSGLDADSGLSRGEYAPSILRYDLTVTFHSAKPGHMLQDGPEQCGALRVVDIGLPVRRAGQRVPDNVVRLTSAGAGLGKYVGHKYSHGHALVLSGPAGHGGAARLAARGALRIGAGVVTLACPPDAVGENAARLDAVMLRALDIAATLVDWLGDARINALCLGPGLGVSRGDLVAAALQGMGKPRAVVLDADALTILSQAPDLFAALHSSCVLTPHAGEFARLFPDIAAKLAAPATKGAVYSKVDAAREAAARAGCVVLLKGPDTVIAGADGRCAINAAAYERAAPWLATAGSGDVLAGFITGLLAREFSAFDAACTGAWLHVECARSYGPGLIAEDLPEALPKVFRGLGI